MHLQLLTTCISSQKNLLTLFLLFSRRWMVLRGKCKQTVLKTNVTNPVTGCLHFAPSTTYSSLCLMLTRCTAQLKLRDVFNLPQAVTQNPYLQNAKKMWDWTRHTSGTNKGKSRARERKKVAEWKTDVPPCTLQDFRLLTSLSRAVLARLCRRRDASSDHYISAYIEFLRHSG